MKKINAMHVLRVCSTANVDTLGSECHLNKQSLDSGFMRRRHVGKQSLYMFCTCFDITQSAAKFLTNGYQLGLGLVSQSIWGQHLLSLHEFYPLVCNRSWRLCFVGLGMKYIMCVYFHRLEKPLNLSPSYVLWQNSNTFCVVLYSLLLLQFTVKYVKCTLSSVSAAAQSAVIYTWLLQQCGSNLT